MAQSRQYPSDTSWAVRLNRWSLWLSKKWLTILLVVIGIYAWLPILAPILMQVGLTGQAQAIYGAYAGMCHQFAYRSWFFFGEQAAYPRESVDFLGLKPYEPYFEQYGAQIAISPGYPQLTDQQRFDLRSKALIGNSQMGYKTAICQRDVAIYLALFFGGVIYSIPVVRRHLRPVPWWLYVLLGLVPIGIDGVSQLLSYPLPPLWTTPLWAVRETTPLFRTVTGALFGLMNAWLAFPFIEESARDAIREIQIKFARRAARLASQERS